MKNQLPITDLVGEKFGLVYKYRRGPAFLTLAFPTIFVWVCLAILLDKGTSSFLDFMFSRQIASPPTFIGFGAFAIWVWKFSIPALGVIFKRGKAIYSDGENLHFFGRTFEHSQIEGYIVEKSIFRNDIKLLSNGGTVVSQSLLFARLE